MLPCACVRVDVRVCVPCLMVAGVTGVVVVVVKG